MRKSLEPKSKSEKYKVVGRPISLGECAFVFSRVWNTTCTHHHEEGEEVDHVHASHSVNEVMLTDLFHVIHHVGILLNKEDPSDDDTTPYEQFKKYAKTISHEGQEIEYCDSDDVPKILLAVFVGQKDEKRIDAASLIQKYADKGEKQVIEHIVDQVWA